MKVIQKSDQEVGKKLKIGGAISGDVRKLDVYTGPVLDYKKIFREAAFLPGAARPREYLHGVVPLAPRNVLGAHTFGAIHTSEQEFHTALLGAVSGRGAKGDHPSVQHAVYESLKHKPDLLATYLHA